MVWQFLNQRNLKENILEGDIFAIVTHVPGQNKWNEFSIVAGYNYEPNSNPDVTIGDMKFQLFTSGSRAWSLAQVKMKKLLNI